MVKTTPTKKLRSPSYPSIGLEEALRRGREFYDHERRNPAPVDTVLHHWGYKPGSGAGVLAIAALRKFGLIEYIGTGAQRKARLTDLAFRIILDQREPSPERDEALRQAALTPAIHSDIRRKFPTPPLPSDSTLRHYLVFDRQFNENAVTLVIDEVRGTWAFAKLDESGTLPDGDASMESQVTQPVNSTVDRILGREGVPPMPATAHAGRSLQIPLPGGGAATLVTSRPITSQEWATLRTVIDAMEASFVEAPPPVHTNDADHSTGADED
jgi:hypothetical protein